MKILIITRLMSGFISSINQAEWNPTGSPALYKLINYLDKTNDTLEIIMTQKGDFLSSQLKYDHDIHLKLRNLSSHITVLSGPENLPRFLGKIRYYVSECFQCWKIFLLKWKIKPDLIYIDRSNILAGACLARLTKTPVVLRLLGVTPAMQSLYSQSALSHSVYRWAYRSPFHTVLCTHDGSPSERWMQLALRQGIPYMTWLNGTDPLYNFESIKKNKIYLIVLGRLDPLKRIEECVAAFLKLPKATLNHIEILIIGDGVLKSTLEATIRNTPLAECVKLTGAIPHSDVQHYLSQGDLYISLNQQGNLSNANLEAMRAGLCFILPEARQDSGVDQSTERIIPNEAAIRIPSDSLIDSLAETIQYLIQHPEEIEQRKAAMRKAAESLKTWDERITREYEFLSNVAS